MGFLSGNRSNKTLASGSSAAGHLETAIGSNASIAGTLKSDGDVRIDGSFEGEIEVLGNVIVGASGRVIASIRAANIHVSGAVKGDLYAQEALEISETGKVWGDISAKALQIEPGGLFQGQSAMDVAEGPLLLEAPPR
jgi:cytoskeletal protein CcmA (bactofilin family)